MSKSIKIEVKPSVRFTDNPESLFVTFDYSLEAVATIKKLPEDARKYIPKERTWEVAMPFANELVNNFKSFEIRMKSKVFTELPEDMEIKKRTEFIDNDLKDFTFKTKPFDHQIEGLMFGKDHPKMFLGDEQGLGKTKQAIDLAVSRKGQFKHCLIVCGVNSVKENWLKEIEVHSNETGHILGSYINRKGKLVVNDIPLQHKLDDLQSDLDDFFLITNIETFRQGPKNKKRESMSVQERTQAEILDTVEELTRNGTIGMVIIDEIHKAKNPTSAQGKAIHRMMPFYKMGLSGTPLVNSPLDLYNLLHWLEIENHSFFQFKKFYTEQGGWGGSEVVGYKNLDHLHSNLNKVMLRRKKDDVLNLPPKIRQPEYVQLSGAQAKLYKGMRDELVSQIDEIVLSSNPLAMLTRLRQVTSYPEILSPKIKENAKFERMEEMLEELVANGKKAIVFSNWSKVTLAVKERLAKYNPAYIDGTVKDRMDQVEKFQKDDKCKVIVGTIGAMGTGLTLTAASTVFFLDKPWNPANEEQAEDRAHRIGTTGTVNIVSLIAKDSIDYRIEELIANKRDLADEIVDGKMNVADKRAMIESLLF